NIFTQYYLRGIPQERLKVVGECSDTGTEITFMPDGEIFETLIFEFDTLKIRLKELAYLNRGLTIVLKDLREEPIREESYLFQGGIAEFVELLNKNKNKIFSEVILLQDTTPTGELEIALQYNDTF